jgi:hypothetical protein
VLRRSVVDRGDRDARLQAPGEQVGVEARLVAGAEPAAVDVDHQRRGLVGLRLPQVDHVPLVWTVLGVLHVGCGEFGRLGMRPPAGEQRHRLLVARVVGVNEFEGGDPAHESVARLKYFTHPTRADLIE